LENLESSREENESLRQTNNQFATSMRRSNDAMGVEIMQYAINFLNERRNRERLWNIQHLEKSTRIKICKIIYSV